MKTYKTLLFDADRTLFDFNMAEYQAIRKLCAYLEIPFSDNVYNTYSTLNDALWKQFEKKEITHSFLQKNRFEQFLNKLGRQGDPEKLNSMYLSFLAEGSYLLNDAFYVCEKLSKKYDMAIITNGLIRAQTNRFNNSDIAPFFSKLYISEQIGVQKPDKKYFDYVLNDISIDDKSSVLVIGDSLSSDILGAQNAGLDSCWFNPKNAECTLSTPPTYTISDLKELLEML